MAASRFWLSLLLHLLVAPIQVARAMGFAFVDHPKAVGWDGFDMGLLKEAPLWVQQAYHNELCKMIRAKDFPVCYHRWIAMLAMKPGEDPRELGRRRDLWVTCHAQKLIMRLLQPEYDDAVTGTAGGQQGVPGSQGGYQRARGGCTEHLAICLSVCPCYMRA